MPHPSPPLASDSHQAPYFPLEDLAEIEFYRRSDEENPTKINLGLVIQTDGIITATRAQRSTPPPSSCAQALNCGDIVMNTFDILYEGRCRLFPDLVPKPSTRPAPDLPVEEMAFASCALIGVDQTFSLARHTCRITPQRDRILPEYLHHILNSIPFRDELYKKSIGNFLNIHLKEDTLKKLNIPTPTLESQQNIIANIPEYHR